MGKRHTENETEPTDLWKLILRSIIIRHRCSGAGELITTQLHHWRILWRSAIDIPSAQWRHYIRHPYGPDSIRLRTGFNLILLNISCDSDKMETMGTCTYMGQTNSTSVLQISRKNSVSSEARSYEERNEWALASLSVLHSTTTRTPDSWYVNNVQSWYFNPGCYSCNGGSGMPVWSLPHSQACIPWPMWWIHKAILMSGGCKAA